MVFLVGALVWKSSQIYVWWGWTTADGEPAVSFGAVEVAILAIVLATFIFSWRALR
jgi:hypothetical protein